MRPRRPARLFACLRLLALFALVIGLMARPALAVACVLDDAQPVAEVRAAGVATGAATPDACCPGESCDDCCTSAGAMVPAPAMVSAAPLQRPACVTRACAFAPPSYPVAVRPPIAG